LVLATKKLSGPILLVPVPDSDCPRECQKIPRTVHLARAISGHSKHAVVSDVLRWKKAGMPSHRGGTRDPQQLFDRLVVTDVLPRGKLVLVDDVFTTGNHIRAGAAKISDPVRRCSYAVCLGRTVLEQQDKPFAIVEEDLRDFYPASGWPTPPRPSSGSWPTRVSPAKSAAVCV
jgi:hypothetical protein